LGRGERGKKRTKTRTHGKRRIFGREEGKRDLGGTGGNRGHKFRATMLSKGGIGFTPRK